MEVNIISPALYFSILFDIIIRLIEDTIELLKWFTQFRIIIACIKINDAIAIYDVPLIYSLWQAGLSHHWVGIFLCLGCLGDSEDSDSLLQKGLVPKRGLCVVLL